MISVCQNRINECEQKYKGAKENQKRLEDRLEAFCALSEKRNQELIENVDIIERELRTMKRKLAGVFQFLHLEREYHGSIHEDLPTAYAERVADEVLLGEQENIFLKSLTQ